MRNLTDYSFEMYLVSVFLMFGQVGCDSESHSQPPAVPKEVQVDMGPTPDVGLSPLVFTPSSDASPEFSHFEQADVDQLWILPDEHFLTRTASVYQLHIGENITTFESELDIQSCAFADGLLIVSDGGSLYVLNEHHLQRSPLNELLQAPIQIKSSAHDRFWISHASGILLWRDGELITVSDTLQFDDHAFAWSATRADRDELLIWHGDSASHLRLVGNAVNIELYEFEEFPLQIGLSTMGVWSLSETKLFLHDGVEWRFWNPPESVSGLLSAGNSDTIYLTSSETIIQLREDSYTQLTRPEGLAHMQVGSQGTLMGTQPGQITFLRPALSVSLVGIPEGLLTAPAVVEARWNTSIEVTDIRWTLNDQAIEGNTASVNLLPSFVPLGANELVVSVTFNDERVAVGRDTILGPPSWTQHIEGIATSFCLSCHNAGAPTELFEATHWVENFDAIAYNLETERMPLTQDKLSADQVSQVLGWMLANFPIGEE